MFVEASLATANTCVWRSKQLECFSLLIIRQLELTAKTDPGGDGALATDVDARLDQRTLELSQTTEQGERGKLVAVIA
jgi:hypothetical protein